MEDGMNRRDVLSALGGLVLNQQSNLFAAQSVGQRRKWLSLAPESRGSPAPMSWLDAATR